MGSRDPEHQPQAPGTPGGMAAAPGGTVGASRRGAEEAAFHPRGPGRTVALEPSFPKFPGR